MLKTRKNSLYSRKFPTELKEWKYKIEEAGRAVGLEFPPFICEVVTAKEMAGLAAYSGLPSRFSHWSFGQHYDHNLKQLIYRGSGILEMVGCSDPFIAYLQEGNSLATQKSVISHVLAHLNFLSTNLWAKSVCFNYVDEFANHSSRIARYIQKYGLERVESFIDACLSIETLIDTNREFFKRRREAPKEWVEKEKKGAGGFKAKGYMDSYINPPEWIKEQEEKLKKEAEERKNRPIDSDKDIMLFLLEHGRMENWEKDILSMLREESYYFIPLGRTKTGDEGWASYWQSLIMTGSDVTNPYRDKIYSGKKVPPPILMSSELLDYADEMARVIFNRGYNPYRVGLWILRDIEERWNKGRFGKEWEEETDREKLKSWDKKLGLGREKIFEVMKLCDDIAFIDTYLTQELVDALQLFVWKRDEKKVKIKTRELKAVKKALLYQMMNLGRPTVEVTDVKKNGDLHLTHRWDGVGLDQGRTRAVLSRIATFFWRRGDACIETMLSSKETWFEKAKS